MLVIEKTFGFTSTVTLFELSNTNNPLLRELNEKAPARSSTPSPWATWERR